MKKNVNNIISEIYIQEKFQKKWKKKQEGKAGRQKEKK